MAQPTLPVIQAIRNAAQKIQHTNHYQWGHMGACNCGYLAQVVTKLTRQEIHRRAMMRQGDWCGQLNEYCATSHLPMDHLIGELLSFGFDAEDLRHLERLSDQTILAALPDTKCSLCFNIQDDVVRYMKTWANLLEDQLLENACIGLCEVEDSVPIV